ncbi:MAG: type VI secretion system protein TssA [Cystobacter sp.]
MTPMSQELEPLLQPISAEHPSGRNLRYEPLYEQLREARREDDATLSQGVWQTPLKLANWGRVVELSQPALTRESKDLQLAAWLTEAWLFQGGLEGLARGLQLLTALVDRFWDTLWPELDPEDTDTRLAPLKWLDDRLPIALGRTPLVWPRAASALSFGDWQLILRREKQGGARAEEPAEPAPQTAAHAPPQTREAFLAAGTRMPAESLAQSREQLEQVLARAAALEQTLTARLGQPTVVFHRTRSGLEEFQSLLTLLGSHRAPLPSAVPPGPGGDSPSTPVSLAGGIHSRAEAYQLLSLAADYLMGTEPHSPVPYLVRRALAWGDMPLGKLLGELVPDSSGLSAIHTLLGMKPQE